MRQYVSVELICLWLEKVKHRRRLPALCRFLEVTPATAQKWIGERRMGKGYQARLSAIMHKLKERRMCWRKLKRRGRFNRRVELTFTGYDPNLKPTVYTGPSVGQALVRQQMEKLLGGSR